MLIGNYSAALSLKRRVAIPKKFREQMGANIIVARWYDKCLVLVSNTNWENLIKRITGNSRMVTSHVRDTDRFIMGSAFELEADDQGRVILPSMLVNFAGFSDEVVFIGLGDRVEIWDKTEWEKRNQMITQNAENLLEELAKDKEVIS